MAVSRSALEYMRRKGLYNEPVNPAPRLNITGLLIHSIPIAGRPLPPPEVLRHYEGQPPPDRGATQPWPYQQG